MASIIVPTAPQAQATVPLVVLPNVPVPTDSVQVVKEDAMQSLTGPLLLLLGLTGLAFLLKK